MRYTEKQIAELKTISHNTAESVYRVPGTVCHVVVDNKDGLGVVPDNGNVMYKGFVGHMLIDTFLSLVPSSFDVAPRAQDLAKLMKARHAIGNPFISINIDGYIDHEQYSLARITGHEGRARATAMALLGVKIMPVHIFFDRVRRREIKKVNDFIAYLQAGILPEKEGKPAIKKVLTGDILI